MVTETGFARARAAEWLAAADYAQTLVDGIDPAEEDASSIKRDIASWRYAASVVQRHG